MTCSKFRPTKAFGVQQGFDLALIHGDGRVGGHALDEVALAAPSCLTFFAAAWEWTRMASWRACRSPPRFTDSIITFSVAMKGSFSMTRRRMT